MRLRGPIIVEPANGFVPCISIIGEHCCDPCIVLKQAILQTANLMEIRTPTGTVVGGLNENGVPFGTMKSIRVLKALEEIREGPTQTVNFNKWITKDKGTVDCCNVKDVDKHLIEIRDGNGQAVAWFDMEGKPYGDWQTAGLIISKLQKK